MSETIDLNFEGHVLAFAPREGEYWANTDEVAEALGYSSRRKLLNLYKRHEADFLPCDTGIIELRTPGGVQQCRIFSTKGIELLGMFGPGK